MRRRVAGPEAGRGDRRDAVDGQARTAREGVAFRLRALQALQRAEDVDEPHRHDDRQTRPHVGARQRGEQRAERRHGRMEPDAGEQVRRPSGTAPGAPVEVQDPRDRRPRERWRRAPRAARTAAAPRRGSARAGSPSGTKAMSGCSKVLSTNSMEMNPTAIPASVARSAARGVARRTAPATAAPAASMIPDSRHATRPTCQATSPPASRRHAGARRPLLEGRAPSRRARTRTG